MSVFQLSPSDMTTASNAVTEAADNARGHGSSAHLSTAGGAIPGATSVGYLSELGTSWDDDIVAWADNAESFGTRIAATSDDAQGTDEQSGGLFGGLLGLLGGN
jgi:hypothetical protein